jgi:hypothetical protein
MNVRDQTLKGSRDIRIGEEPEREEMLEEDDRVLAAEFAWSESECRLLAQGDSFMSVLNIH